MLTPEPDITVNLKTNDTIKTLTSLIFVAFKKKNLNFTNCAFSHIKLSIDTLYQCKITSAALA